MAFTYFFRDLQTLEYICKYSLTELVSKQKINIWDAGCAMGPEPFTMAMLIREQIGYMMFRNVKISATDIDGSDLFDNIIKNAAYPWEQLQRIPKDIFDKYFIPDEKEGCFRIIDEIRNVVQFQKHDLLSLKPIAKDFGLIICKNVLLHFNEQQRIEVINMFHSSLSDGGFLAMEQTQKLPKELENKFEQVVSNAQLFRKRSEKNENC